MSKTGGTTMAKDDFFVIAYRMLAYLYACMKAGEIPDANMISSNGLEIPYRYWSGIVDMLQKAGYIEGNHGYYEPGRLTITMVGIEYLLFHPMMEKAKAFLKEKKEIVQGL